MTDLKDLELIVFSGGECFILGEDLFDAIALAKSLKDTITTRCVTNGYWGRTAAQAKTTVNSATKAGLDKINFSTGLEH